MILIAHALNLCAKIVDKWAGFTGQEAPIRTMAVYEAYRRFHVGFDDAHARHQDLPPGQNVICRFSCRDD